MKFLFYLLAFCIIFFIPKCQANSFNDTWHEVPLTDFKLSQPSTLYFFPETLQFQVKIENQIIQTPNKILPIKIIEDRGRKIIFARHLFEGTNKLYICGTDQILSEIKFPTHLKKFIFLNAALTDREIIAIYYNPVAMRHFLFRFDLENNKFDTEWFREIDYGKQHLSNHMLNVSIFSAPDKNFGKKEPIYIIGGNAMYIYRNIIYPDLQKIEFPEKFCFTFFNQEGDKYYAYFKNTESLKASETDEKIRKYDLLNLTYTLEKFSKDIEWNNLETQVKKFNPSGLLHMGVNNDEGLVVWSQVYYLNGLINLLKKWEHVNFSIPEDLRKKIKMRLDLEIYLLNQLIIKKGLHSLRYSVNRKPIAVSLHIARVHRLLRRYQQEIANPLKVNSLDLLESLLKFKHPNILVDTISTKTVFSNSKLNINDPGVGKEECFLHMKKSAVFPHDGINLPYNYMNSLTGELAQFKNLPPQSLLARFIKDATRIFLRNEGFYQKFPTDFNWHYSWGWMRQGRAPKDKLSTNLPYYPPDNSMADISYKTMDLVGLLSVYKIHRELFPKYFLQFCQQAFKIGAVYPFVYEELEHSPCDLDIDIALYYSYPTAAYELQSASIAYLYLVQKNQNETHH